LSWASVAVSAVGVGSSIYKGLKANSADKAAAREGASLKRPFYQIPEEYIQNRNILGQQAQGGLSADEKNYMGEQRERGLSSSLEALKQTGGGPNDFAQLNQVFGDSLKSQAALDAQLHMKNIEFFTNANKDLAGQKATAFGINELQPYESKLKEIQDRRIAAQTNENNAIDEGIGSLSAVATGLNSRNPRYGNTNPGSASLSPYSRTFGLANPGGVAGSPAAGFPSINTNAPNILNPPAGAPATGDGFPQFTPDEWGQMKQDAWDEGSNTSMWNQ
jgi:hypothetical protein